VSILSSSARGRIFIVFHMTVFFAHLIFFIEIISAWVLDYLRHYANGVKIGILGHLNISVP